MSQRKQCEGQAVLFPIEKSPLRFVSPSVSNVRCPDVTPLQNLRFVTPEEIS